MIRSMTRSVDERCQIFLLICFKRMNIRIKVGGRGNINLNICIEFRDVISTFIYKELTALSPLLVHSLKLSEKTIQDGMVLFVCTRIFLGNNCLYFLMKM